MTTTTGRRARKVTVDNTPAPLVNPQLALFENPAPLTSAPGRPVPKRRHEIFTLIHLDLLDRLDDLSPRTHLNPRHIAEFVELLAEDPTALPSIAVVASSDRFLVVDGAHRVAAYRLLGLQTVTVELLSIPPEQTIERFVVAEAIDRAATGPLPLGPGDRKHSCDLLLRLWPELSVAEVARRCGMTREGASKRRSRVKTNQSGNAPLPKGPRARGAPVSSLSRLATHLLGGLARLEVAVDGDEARIATALVDATSQEGLSDGVLRLDLFGRVCASAADRIRTTAGPTGSGDSGRSDA